MPSLGIPGTAPAIPRGSVQREPVPAVHKGSPGSFNRVGLSCSRALLEP